LPIIAKQLSEMASAGLDEVIIVANDPQPYRRFGVEIIPDLRPGLGPLGGIEAALAHYADRVRAALFLPCDLPGVTAREIGALRRAFAAAVAPVVVAATEAETWQPLCAVVAASALPQVRQALEEGRLRVGELWQRLGAEIVRFADARAFLNINTPEDMARWLEARL